MNTKHTLVILAIAGSLGMSNAWSAAAENSDESESSHDHNSQTEENSTGEAHHGWHGPRDTEHGHMTGHGPMHGRMGAMPEERQRMMEEHQKMLSKLESDQADLDKKIEQMNSSTGQEKIDAMSAVINEMSSQRKEMITHMASMQKRMMAHMDHMGSMMGNPESEPAGAPTQKSEEEEK